MPLQVLGPQAVVATVLTRHPTQPRRLLAFIHHLEACLDRSTLQAVLGLMILERQTELRNLKLAAALSSQQIPKSKLTTIMLGLSLMRAAHDDMQGASEQLQLEVASHDLRAQREW